MKRFIVPAVFIPVLLFLFSSLSVWGDVNALGPADILVGNDPDTLFILERDACRIRKIRVDDVDDSGRVSAGSTKPIFLSLSFRPDRMRLFPDRTRLAVVGNGACGVLQIVDVETMTLTAEIPVGHSPSDVAIHQPPGDDSGDGSPVRGDAVLYVSNRFGGDVSVVRLASDGRSGKEIKRFPAGREPIALTVTPSGEKLVVAGHLPEDPALQFDISSKIRFIDTATGETTAIRIHPGAMNLRDIVLCPDARYAFVTGLLGHFEHLPDSVGGGWMNENILYVLDVPAMKLAGTFYLDEHGIGSANPWGVSISDDKRFLLVAAAGSCDLILLNLPQLLEMYDRFTGRTETDRSHQSGSQNRSDFQLPDKMRIPIALKGIRHAVMSKNRIFATSYFEDCIARVVPVFSEPLNYVAGLLPQDNLEIPRSQPWKLRPDVTTPIRSNFVPGNATESAVPASRTAPEGDHGLHFVPLPSFSISRGIRFERSFARLGPEPIWNDARYGEMLFHDAIPCQEHWQSCSSCHPDGRSDTLNWDLLNDGQDNPKNTKSLLFSHETPPSMATGIRRSAEIAVRKGFETILMIPAGEEETDAVDAYLRSLEPIPAPKRLFDRLSADCGGNLSEAARRGKRIFNSDRAGCALCHPEPLFTDMRKHDVGTRSVVDSEPWFDTPTLVEVWRTAPYLHDGRYRTIRELIVDGKHDNTNGRIDRLTEAEIDDLIEYVLSL